MFAYYGLYNSSCSQYQRCKSPSSMLKVLWDTISILLSNALHLFLRTAHVVWRKNAVFSTKECFKDGILYLSSKPFCVIVLIAQSCLTLCSPTDCSSPGSSVHGILQAGTLEWVAVPFSRGSSPPKDWTQVSRTAGRFFTVWATCGTFQQCWSDWQNE